MRFDDWLIRLTVLLSMSQVCLGQTQGPTSATGNDSTPIKPGVVIEKFEADDSGAKAAGMQEGDILLSWSRGDAKGQLESPFELSLVLTEQLPVGPIKFEGVRGTEKQVWFETKPWWGAVTRPNLAETILIPYLAGKKLAESGKLIEAASSWRTMADEKQVPGVSWLGSWFLFHAAELLANGKQWKEADDAYRDAIVRATSAGSAIRAQLLYEWGATLFRRNDYDFADQYLQQAAGESQNAGAGNLTAEALNLLGWVAKDRGDLPRAEKYFRQVQDILEKLEPDSLAIAPGLINLGTVFDDGGDLMKAEEYYLKAQVIFERLAPTAIGVAIILNNLGEVAHRRGELERAEEYYRGALRFAEKKFPNTPPDPTMLCNLASVLDERGDFKQAEELSRRALADQEKLAPRSPEEALVLQRLGVISLHRGDLASAEQFYLRALDIRKRLAPEGLFTAESLDSLGEVHLKRGDLVRSEEYYRQALTIRVKLAPGSVKHAETLAALATIATKQDQLEAAEKLYEASLNALENQTRHLGGSGEQRAVFRGKYEGYYQDYIDLLVDQRQLERAFQVLERARARSLLEALGEGKIDIHRGIGAVLLEKKQSLQTAIIGKSNLRIRVLNGKHAETQVSEINEELNGLIAQYHEVEDKIRAMSPPYAALTRPEPLKVREVQQLLDPNTVLVEYSLGERRSFAFLLTTDSIRAYELPARKTIEKAARHVYELLTVRNLHIRAESVAQRERRWAAAAAQCPNAAAELSRMILWPMADQIRAKRLLAVSDGALLYIPLAILPARPQSPAPLVADGEVVTLPSASVLSMLRRAEMGRKPAPKSVAVLADPVFSKQDARVAEEHTHVSMDSPLISNSALPSGNTLTRSARDVGLSSLQRLPFSRQEAEAIVSAVPAGNGFVALDFKASRAIATSPELGQYRIVHFATHGLLDSQHPELSGLVLSLVDKRGNPQDGFMTLDDIYNLDWSADLVVLSACETGLGKEVRGEGLVGMTQGFMYAGATRVMASLWSVDDVATSAFMARFYRAMFREGLAPAAALRKTQIRMWKQRRWRDPYYWGAFIMQGEWRRAAGNE